ncbi:MAG TPA: hypothetical protein VHO27_05660 [Angustibacter sp.]|nr:hypothetical protein [Angustibacter sp.]
MATAMTTPQALRVMGVWVRRADALLAQGGFANAARAVAEERARAEATERDLAALDLAQPALPDAS